MKQKKRNERKEIKELLEEENLLRDALKKRLANKISTSEQVALTNNNNITQGKPETDSDTSRESLFVEKPISLLEKVNKIIKSCVLLKKEKQTNKKEKKEGEERIFDDGLEEDISQALKNLEDGEISDSDKEKENESLEVTKNKEKLGRANGERSLKTSPSNSRSNPSRSSSK